MNTITIGWEKQNPNEIKFNNKKKVSQNRPTRKNPLAKKKQTTQKIEPHVPRTVRFNELAEEFSYSPYTPLPTRNLFSKPSNNSEDEILVYGNNQLCSIRAVIVTFIIVAVLIAAAGASVGIVFGVIKSSSSSGTGNKNNQNSFTTVASGLLTSSVSIGSQSGPPCSSYTTIDDPTRSITYVGSYGGCDNGPLFNSSNNGAWIRFVGTGGTTIPTTSPGYSRCGAYLSVWFNGTLPLTTNVIINGTGCFDAKGDICMLMNLISVILCPGSPTNYYVYFLRPVISCSARYCTN